MTYTQAQIDKANAVDLGADVDMNRANEVRPIFMRLGQVAQRTGCAILLIGHAPSLLALRGTDFVICNDHGFPINPDSYGALVRRIGQRAGIEGLHPHMFRHTFVSILLSNPEIGVATVAAEAGHAQPSTTLAIYTQVYDKRRKEIRSQMSKELYE